ncbi:MAG: prolipoprotein diacylglyceryl transferase [Candidatus Omnitrophica bacterium]|nr:prolipoprotein diacylglyceryl transferase [Candidatus Omnitrophota bacterium]
MMPVVFQWGWFHIYTYGFFVAAGVLTSMLLMSREASLRGFPSRDQVFDLVFFTVVSGFAGARVLYLIQNWQEYAGQPLRMIAVWEGGLIFYGGQIAALAGLLIFFRLNRLPPLKMLDFLVPYVALTHVFGRVGCFFNGCCSGDPSNLPWAVTFPGESFSRHPAQLYEAALDLLLFLSLQRLKKTEPPEGFVTCGYFLGYAVIRFFIETMRTANPALLHLTYNQWISFAMASGAGLVFLFLKGRHARRGLS